MAENRPLGAIITYWIKDTRAVAATAAARWRARREQKKAAPAIRRKRRSRPKTDEEAPQTFLTITDCGRQGRAPPHGAGHARHPPLSSWNLRGIARRPAAAASPAVGRRRDDDGGGDSRRHRRRSVVLRARIASPLSRRVGGVTTALGDAQTVTVSADPSAARDVRRRSARRPSEYQDNVCKLQRTFTGALEQANNMKTRTTAIRRALVDSPADLKLMDRSGALRSARHGGAARRCAAMKRCAAWNQARPRRSSRG